MKVALLADGGKASPAGRIFHDKLGIFRDSDRNRVVFKGSMNETWSGLAADGNLESIDVAASWMGSRDLERATTEESYFEDLWADRYPTLVVRPFPDVAANELCRAADADWESTVEAMAHDDRPREAPPMHAAGHFGLTKPLASRPGPLTSAEAASPLPPEAGRPSRPQLRFESR